MAERAPGVFAATHRKLPLSADFNVEVVHLTLAPGPTARTIAFPGTGVYEVTSGGGVATVGDKRIELRAGTIFAVSEGEALRVDVREGPLTLRAHLLSGAAQ